MARTYQISYGAEDDWETVEAPADDMITAWIATQEAHCLTTGIDRVRILDETGVEIAGQCFFD